MVGKPENTLISVTQPKNRIYKKLQGTPAFMRAEVQVVFISVVTLQDRLIYGEWISGIFGNRKVEIWNGGN